jgi:molybdate transport system substrate-binding protein
MALRVMSARAVKTAVNALADEFSRAHAIAVVCDFAPVGTLEERFAAGETADVVILSAAAIEKMVAAGKVISGTLRTLGRTSVGVAVREGATPPDIATPETFKAALLSARAISVSDPAVGGTTARYLPQLFSRMGIADALAPKLVLCSGGGDVAERVARGEAELGITFVSEMLPVAGVRVFGTLPAIYANDTTYRAGVMTTAGDPQVASELIAALALPRTREAWHAAGFDLED